jgi:hypothetical protein
MTKSLVQYFIKNGHLDLPTIGVLRWSKQESVWQNNQLTAPKETIILDRIVANPTKHFYSFLAEDLGLSIEQAHVQFENYIADFTSKKIASLNIGSLGTLLKNEEEVSWNNLYNADIYYKDITINPSINSDIVNELPIETKKDYWWVWTILIAFIALALIFYKQ